MTVVFVTAIVAPKTGAFQRPLDVYVRHFQSLVATGISIVAFVDERLDVSLPISSNVDYRACSMKDRWIDTDQLPESRTATKDTASYMSIQLSKLWFVCNAATFRPDTDTFAWIDFGVFHMFRDTKACSRNLVQIANYPWMESSTIYAPGAWRAMPCYPIWDKVCWRFCGSFLLGHRVAFQRALVLQDSIVQKHLPKLTWEVNVWTLMDDMFTWYPGDHNDSLLSIPM